MIDATDLHLNKLRDAEERALWERRLHDESWQSPRFYRAKMFADMVCSGLRDYMAVACFEKAYEETLLRAFQMDMMIVQVPPEWDALDRVALQQAMLTKKIDLVMKDMKS